MVCVCVTGTWVQCDEASCKKWRYLPDVCDPGLLPERWTCSMNTGRNLCLCVCALCVCVWCVYVYVRALCVCDVCVCVCVCTHAYAGFYSVHVQNKV